MEPSGGAVFVTADIGELAAAFGAWLRAEAGTHVATGFDLLRRTPCPARSRPPPKRMTRTASSMASLACWTDGEAKGRSTWDVVQPEGRLPSLSARLTEVEARSPAETPPRGAAEPRWICAYLGSPTPEQANIAHR